MAVQSAKITLEGIPEAEFAFNLPYESDETAGISPAEARSVAAKFSKLEDVLASYNAYLESAGEAPLDLNDPAVVDRVRKSIRISMEGKKVALPALARLLAPPAGRAARPSGTGPVEPAPRSSGRSQIFNAETGTPITVAGVDALKFDTDAALSEAEAKAIEPLLQLAVASITGDKTANERLRALGVISNTGQRYTGEEIMKKAGKPLDPTVVAVLPPGGGAAEERLFAADVAGIDDADPLTRDEATKIDDAVLREALTRSATNPRFSGLDEEARLEKIVIVYGGKQYTGLQIRQRAERISADPKMEAYLVDSSGGSSHERILSARVAMDLDDTLTPDEAKRLYERLVKPALDRAKTLPEYAGKPDKDILNAIVVPVGGSRFSGSKIAQRAGVIPLDSADSADGTDDPSEESPLTAPEPDYAVGGTYDGYGDPIHGYTYNPRYALRNLNTDAQITTEALYNTTSTVQGVHELFGQFGIGAYGALYGYGLFTDVDPTRAANKDRRLRGLAILMLILTGNTGFLEDLDNHLRVADMSIAQKAMARQSTALWAKRRAVSEAKGRIDFSKPENRAAYDKLATTEMLLATNEQALKGALNLYQEEASEARRAISRRTDRIGPRNYFTYSS